MHGLTVMTIWSDFQMVELVHPRNESNAGRRKLLLKLLQLSVFLHFLCFAIRTWLFKLCCGGVVTVCYVILLHGLRIAISGPDDLSPYEFLTFPMEWVAEGHQLSDQPGATRGPGKKSLERIREEEEYKSIFNPDQFYAQFYFSLVDEDDDQE
ncbi:hypothetical protein RB195_004986 [Necator americanus]|uniref:Uncharacterized protein n=1 Tax=Necator americanus TaxID=51031 RepID=A0ABR1BNZ2_NECAM